MNSWEGLMSYAADNDIDIPDEIYYSKRVKLLRDFLFPPKRKEILTYEQPLDAAMRLGYSAGNVEHIYILTNPENPYILSIVFKNGTIYNVPVEQLEFLYNLQKQGTVNMILAGGVLQKQFGLTKEVADTILRIYMTKYQELKNLLQEKLATNILGQDVAGEVMEFVRGPRKPL